MTPHELISKIHNLGYNTPVMVDVDSFFAVSIQTQDLHLGVICWNIGENGLLKFYKAFIKGIEGDFDHCEDCLVIFLDEARAFIQANT